MNEKNEQIKELCNEIVDLLKKISKEQISLRKDYFWMSAMVFGFIVIDFLLKIK